MKLSVSLTDDDLTAIDDFAREAGLRSRSAVIQYAVRRLGLPDLEDAYAQAWDEWEATGEAAAWESVTGDGLSRAAG